MSLVPPIDEPQPGVIPPNIEIRADPDEETAEGARPAAAQATTSLCHWRPVFIGLSRYPYCVPR
jgi:hypothetical protein